MFSYKVHPTLADEGEIEPEEMVDDLKQTPIDVIQELETQMSKETKSLPMLRAQYLQSFVNPTNSSEMITFSYVQVQTQSKKSQNPGSLQSQQNTASDNLIETFKKSQTSPTASKNAPSKKSSVSPEDEPLLQTNINDSVATNQEQSSFSPEARQEPKQELKGLRILRELLLACKKRKEEEAKLDPIKYYRTKFDKPAEPKEGDQNTQQELEDHYDDDEDEGEDHELVGEIDLNLIERSTETCNYGIIGLWRCVSEDFRYECYKTFLVSRPVSRKKIFGNDEVLHVGLDNTVFCFSRDYKGTYKLCHLDMTQTRAELGVDDVTDPTLIEFLKDLPTKEESGKDQLLTVIERNQNKQKQDILVYNFKDQMHFLQFNGGQKHLWTIDHARFLLDYDAQADTVWVYQKEAELQKWKFNGKKPEKQYTTRFYETPEWEVVHAEIHDQFRKFSVVTFNLDLQNPLYNVKTYKLGEPQKIKFDVTKFSDVYDPKLVGDARYKKPLKIAKIANRLLAQDDKKKTVFGELAMIDKMSNLEAKQAAQEKLKNNFLSRFAEGVSNDEELKIESYENCIKHTAEANLFLISQIQDSVFEPKLFVKKGIEEEKVEQSEGAVIFSMSKLIKSKQGFLDKAADFVKSKVMSKQDQLLCLQIIDIPTTIFDKNSTAKAKVFDLSKDVPDSETPFKKSSPQLEADEVKFQLTRNFDRNQQYQAKINSFQYYTKDHFLASISYFDDINGQRSIEFANSVNQSQLLRRSQTQFQAPFLVYNGPSPLNNQLVYQSADSAKSVFVVSLGNLQFVSFVEEQANFDKSFYMIAREQDSKKMVLVRLEVDQSLDAEGVCPLKLYRYRGAFNSLQKHKIDLYNDQIIKVTMLQLQKKLRTRDYRHLLTVQSENQGIFTMALNLEDDEEIDHELVKICELQMMSHVPMISFNSLKNQSNATLYIRKLKENKDFQATVIRRLNNGQQVECLDVGKECEENCLILSGKNVLSDTPIFRILASTELLITFTLTTTLNNVEEWKQVSFKNEYMWSKKDQTAPPSMAVLDEQYQIIGSNVVDIRAANFEGIDFVNHKQACETLVNKENSKFIGSVCYSNTHLSTMDNLLTIGTNINYTLLPCNFEFVVQFEPNSRKVHLDPFKTHTYSREMENVFISKHTLIRFNRDESANIPFTFEAYDVNTGNKKEVVYQDEAMKDHLHRMISLSQNRRFAYCKGLIKAVKPEENKDKIDSAPPADSYDFDVPIQVVLKLIEMDNKLYLHRSSVVSDEDLKANTQDEYKFQNLTTAGVDNEGNLIMISGKTVNQNRPIFEKHSQLKYDFGIFNIKKTNHSYKIYALPTLPKTQSLPGVSESKSVDIFKNWPKSKLENKANKTPLERRKSLMPGMSLDEKSLEASTFGAHSKDSPYAYQYSQGLHHKFLINDKYLIVFHPKLKCIWVVTLAMKVKSNPRNYKWSKYYKRIDFSKPILGAFPTVKPEVLQIHKKDSVILFNIEDEVEMTFNEYHEENENANVFIENGYKNQQVASTYHVPRTANTMGKCLIDFLVPRYNNSDEGVIYRQFTFLDIALFKRALVVHGNQGNLQEFFFDALSLDTMLGYFAGRTFFHIFQDIEAVNAVKKLMENEDQTTNDQRLIDIRDHDRKRLVSIINLPDCYGRFALNLASQSNQLDVFERIFEFNMKAGNMPISRNFLLSLGFMMDSDSPVTDNFFDNAQVETKYCQNITKVFWDLEEYNIAFTHNSSEIDIKTVQQWTAPDEEHEYEDEGDDDDSDDEPVKALTSDAISQGSSNVLENLEDEGDQFKFQRIPQKIIETESQSKAHVKVTMLDIDWILQDDDIKTLLKKMSEIDNDTFFTKPAVMALVQVLWRVYYAKIYDRLFKPFFVYFFLVVIYFSFFLHDRSEKEDITTLEHLLIIGIQISILVCIIGFLGIELIQLNNGSFCEYISDFWNMTDVCSMILNATIIFLSNYGSVDFKTIRLIASIAIFIIWLKMFFWMRLFESTSGFIRMLTETLLDIKVFMIMLMLCLFMFGNTTLILNQNRYDVMIDEGSGEYEPAWLVGGHFGPAYVDAIVDQYMLGLGEFQMDYYNEGDSYILWILFIMSTFITQITFFNMLIAIMGDTFARVSEGMEQATIKEQVQMMNEHAWVLDLDESFGDQRYIFSVEKQLGEGESGAWQGQVAAMRQMFENAIQKAQDAILTKSSEIIQNQNSMRSKLTEKLDKVQLTLTQKMNNNTDELSSKIQDLNDRLSGKITSFEKNATEMNQNLLKKTEETGDQLNTRTLEMEKQLISKTDEMGSSLTSRQDSMSQSFNEKNQAIVNEGEVQKNRIEDLANKMIKDLADRMIVEISTKQDAVGQQLTDKQNQVCSSIEAKQKEMQDSLGEKQVALDATIAKLMEVVNQQARENEERLKSLADTQNSLSAGQKAAEEQAKRQLELQQAAAREKEREKNAAAMGHVVKHQLDNLISEAMDECIGKEKKKKGGWF